MRSSSLSPGESTPIHHLQNPVSYGPPLAAAFLCCIVIGVLEEQKQLPDKADVLQRFKPPGKAGERGREAGRRTMSQQAAKRQQVDEGVLDVGDLYEEAIETTIAQSKLLQNAKVLAAIEKQWRQSLRRMQAEHKRAAAASRQAATAASASKACGGCPAHEQPQPACGSCGPSDEGSSVSNEAPSDLGSSRPPSAAPGSAHASSEVSGLQPASAGDEEEAGDTDDDFEDAEVDEAEETPPLPTTQAPAVPQGMQQQQQQQGSSLARNEEEKGETQRAQQKSNAKAAEQIGSDEDCEEGSGLTLDDVSDLDDREPPTSDGIFAFYEKVERSAAGAARRTSKWRVLLRYGIIRKTK